MTDRIPQSRIEPVAVAVRRLLYEGEITDLSVRNIAIYVGCSPSTLLHRFGSRRSLLAHVAQWIGEAWLEVVYRETARGTLEVFGLHEVSGWDHLRGWLAMGELARGDDWIAREVAAIEREERRLLERVLPPGTDLATRDAWVALVRGLQHALAARVSPLPIEQARAAAQLFTSALSDRPGSTPRSA
jgi:AcrR family transcriptional regulator